MLQRHSGCMGHECPARDYIIGASERDFVVSRTDDISDILASLGPSLGQSLGAIGFVEGTQERYSTC